MNARRYFTVLISVLKFMHCNILKTMLDDILAALLKHALLHCFGSACSNLSRIMLCQRLSEDSCNVVVLCYAEELSSLYTSQDITRCS